MNPPNARNERLAACDIPSVSVVMSCFNDEKCVSEAIISLQQQTLSDWELIAIDDGSGDSTLKILNAFAAADSRIRVINQQNTGLTRALIIGCDAARGKYIARHDADDRSQPERLERQFQYLEADTRIGFVSSWTDSYTPDGAILDQFRGHGTPEAVTKRLLNERQGPPAHGSVMIRKATYSQAGGYRECFYFGQDSDLWLRMAECSLYGIIDAKLYSFLRSPVSISGKSRSIQQQFGVLGHKCRAARLRGEDETLYLKQAEQLTQHIRSLNSGDATADRKNEIAMCYLIGSQLVNNGDTKARTYLLKVLRHQPWHWKAWVRLGQSVFNGGKLNPGNGEST